MNRCNTKPGFLGIAPAPAGSIGRYSPESWDSKSPTSSGPSGNIVVPEIDGENNDGAPASKRRWWLNRRMAARGSEACWRRQSIAWPSLVPKLLGTPWRCRIWMACWALLGWSALAQDLGQAWASDGFHLRRRLTLSHFDFWKGGLLFCFSPPARWGLLDFMSTPAPSPPRPPPPPRRTSTTMITPECSLPDLNHDHPRPVFAAGPQPRPATPSVRCRTSTTTSHAQCSLPDLNHDQPRPVFAAGPQPRPATPSVRCRTSTTTINTQCSLPDLNSYAKSYAR